MSFGLVDRGPSKFQLRRKQAVEIAPGRGDLTRNSVALNGDWLTTPLDVLLAGGKTVSYANIYATQPRVFAAVQRMLQWSVRVPLKAYRTRDHARLDTGDHPVAEAIVRPWDRAGQAQLLQAMLGPMLIHGNALLTVERAPRSGRLSFEAKDWRRVLPIKGMRYGSISGWEVDRDTADEREVSVDYALHCAWWSPLGPLGVSPLQALGTTINVEDAARRWMVGSMENSGRPPSGIKADKEFLGLAREERQQLLQNLRDDVTRLYTGPENAGRPVVFPPGLSWDPIGHTAVEAELIDQRKINVEEINAVYQIPPPMVAVLDNATYSNIDTQREMIYTESVGPPLVLIETLFNVQVVNALYGDDVYVEFDFGKVLRGDRLKEIQALREAIGTGVLSPNEARGALDLEPSTAQGADDLWMPTNNLSRLLPEGEEPPPPPAPPPAPEQQPAEEPANA